MFAVWEQIFCGKQALRNGKRPCLFGLASSQGKGEPGFSYLGQELPRCFSLSTKLIHSYFLSGFLSYVFAKHIRKLKAFPAPCMNYCCLDFGRTQRSLPRLWLCHPKWMLFLPDCYRVLKGQLYKQLKKEIDKFKEEEPRRSSSASSNPRDV